MKKDPEFKQDRGSWFASVDGFAHKLGVHTTDRCEAKPYRVRLFTDDPDDDTPTRARQIESATRDGVIVLRHYDLATKSAGAKVGVFRGEVRMIDGKPWFFILERMVK